MRSRPDANELADLVAQSAAAEGAAGAADDTHSRRPGKRARVYLDHRTASEITAGIKSGKLHQVDGDRPPQCEVWLGASWCLGPLHSLQSPDLRSLLIIRLAGMTFTSATN